MRGDGVGELGIVLDLARGAEHLGRDLLVELHIALELGHDRARQRLDLVLRADRLLDALDLGLEIVLVLGVALDGGAARALDQHLDGAVGQLQQLEHRGERAHGVDAVGRRLVVARVLLGDEQDLLVRPHHLFEGGDRLLAPDEQRHDHVGEDDNVAERQDRIKLRGAFLDGGRFGFGHGSSVAFLLGRDRTRSAALSLPPPPEPARRPSSIMVDESVGPAAFTPPASVRGDRPGRRQVAAAPGRAAISHHFEWDSPNPASRNDASPRQALVPSSSWRSE